MKRRLELMPEVLPAPTKVATSPVRARTIARLRALAAVGAGIAAACAGKTTDDGLPDGQKPDGGGPYGVVDPLPPPACFAYDNPPTATVAIVTEGEAGLDGGIDAGSTDVDSRYLRVVVTWPQTDVAVGDVTPYGSDLVVVRTTPSPGQVEVILLQTADQYGDPQGKIFRPSQFNVSTSCAVGPTTVTVHISGVPLGAQPDGGAPTVDVSFEGHR